MRAVYLLKSSSGFYVIDVHCGLRVNYMGLYPINELEVSDSLRKNSCGAGVIGQLPPLPKGAGVAFFYKNCTSKHACH